MLAQMRTTYRPHPRLAWLHEVAAKAATDECIEWPFKPGPAGYGRLCIDYKQTMASHVVLELTGRPRPQVDDYYGAVARHACDNPPCCNPRHLSWGTQQDNIADMRAKGRAARGERTGSAKLTEENVREIRTLGSQGWSQRELGARFGVSGVAAGQILRGKTWKHVR